MFGAPDLEPDDTRWPDIELPASSHPVVPDEDELPWPLGRNSSSTFFLNERVSPRGVSLRDRPLWLTLVISLLFHLLIFSQLLHNSALSTMMAILQPPPRPRVEEPIPSFFQMVEIPNDKEEKPARKNAPGSDLDRRAHGGEGAPSDRPGSQGNTPELRLEVPSAGSTGADGADGVKVTGRGEQGEGEGLGVTRGPGAEDGATPTPPATTTQAGIDRLRLPEAGGGQNRPRLRGLGGYGPGSVGGAVPNRKGGQVDVGPISFDTEWYDWGPYAAQMLRRIRYHWQIPEIARLGVTGVVRIRFFIERDGRVTGVVVESPSEHPPMTFAARDAIINASPLPPLPPDLGGVEHEGVTITFYYNMPIPVDG